MYMYTLFLISSLILAVVNAQVSCDNYGVANGSSCACPPGFGGSTCSDPGCGGDIFQGTSRSLAQAKTDTSPSFANLTASSCSCEDGWGGFGCNVCQVRLARLTAIVLLLIHFLLLLDRICLSKGVLKFWRKFKQHPRLWHGQQHACMQHYISGQRSGYDELRRRRA